MSPQTHQQDESPDSRPRTGAPNPAPPIRRADIPVRSDSRIGTGAGIAPVCIRVAADKNVRAPGAACRTPDAPPLPQTIEPAIESSNPGGGRFIVLRALLVRLFSALEFQPVSGILFQRRSDSVGVEITTPCICAPVYPVPSSKVGNLNKGLVQWGVWLPKANPRLEIVRFL